MADFGSWSDWTTGNWDTSSASNLVLYTSTGGTSKTQKKPESDDDLLDAYEWLDAYVDEPCDLGRELL